MDKWMKKFLGFTVAVFVCVIGMATYLFVDGHNLLSSVLNISDTQQQAETDAQTPANNLEKTYNYKKVKIVDYAVDGGSVVFNVEDQKVGFVDSYVASCVNKEDASDVMEAHYSIPSIKVYGLLEGVSYKCYVAIEREGQLYGKSRLVNIKTGESSYEKVEISDVQTSFDSVTLQAKNQFIDYQDRYAAKCFAKGTRAMVEEAGKGGFEAEGEDAKVVIGGLDQNTDYDCFMMIKNNEGVMVNESDLMAVKTRIGMLNIAATDVNVTLEVDDQKISADDFYFAQCTMKNDEKNIQKAFSSNQKLVVEGLTPESEYNCYVGVESTDGTKTRTDDVVVKTLENPYGKIEITSTVVEPTMIEFEVKDLVLSYRDFYVARCENTQNKDLVYLANSKYPKIRVRDMVPSQEYECVLSVEMPTRTVGKSDPITLKTPEMAFPFAK